MLITVKEYALKNGKSRKTIFKYVKAGLIKSAVMVGHTWVLEAEEDCPIIKRGRPGKYSNWREKYPIKNPGRQGNRKPPRPIRDVYVVFKIVNQRGNGGHFTRIRSVLYASYERTDAVEQYYKERDLIKESDGLPMGKWGPDTSRSVELLGYRIHTDKGASAYDSLETAQKRCELRDNKIIYMLNDDEEWSHPKYGLE